MPAKKTRKTGAGRRKAKPKVGGALMQTQAGRGFISDMLPFPMNKLAGMVGLGKKKQRGGFDAQGYVKALLRSASDNL
jgi:hypothetical protein